MTKLCTLSLSVLALTATSLPARVPDSKCLLSRVRTYEVDAGTLVEACGGIAGGCRIYGLSGSFRLYVGSYFAEILESDLHLHEMTFGPHPFPTATELQPTELIAVYVSDERVRLISPGDAATQVDWTLSLAGRAATLDGSYAEGCSDCYVFRFDQVPLTATSGILDSSRLVGNHPAATLLIPYFEVDVDNPAGKTTLASITNASADPLLARVVLWTNWGLPTLAFDLYLKGYNVQSLNLRQILVDGQFPATGSGSGSIPGSPGCTDPLTNPVLDAAARAELIARHTGHASPGDGLCYSGPPPESGAAVGFLTVDALNDCSEAIRYPGDEGYFGPGGTGLVSNRNDLWGDFFLLDRDGNMAQGFEAVAVVADAEQFGEGRNYTFYQPFVDYDGGDDRSFLGRRVRSRFLNDRFDQSTHILMWIEWPGWFSPIQGGVECGENPFQEKGWLAIDVIVHDEDGNEVSTTAIEISELVLRLKVGGDTLPTAKGFGIVDLSAEWTIYPVAGVPFGPQDLQIWAMTLISAGDRFSVGLHALQFDDPCL